MVTRPGDLWLLDKHRLLCGNATNLVVFAFLMVGQLAQIVLCDLPYNVPIEGHVCGLGKAHHGDFAMAVFLA